MAEWATEEYFATNMLHRGLSDHGSLNCGLPCLDCYHVVVDTAGSLGNAWFAWKEKKVFAGYGIAR